MSFVCAFCVLFWEPAETWFHARRTQYILWAVPLYDQHETYRTIQNGKMSQSANSLCITRVWRRRQAYKHRDICIQIKSCIHENIWLNRVCTYSSRPRFEVSSLLSVWYMNNEISGRCMHKKISLAHVRYVFTFDFSLSNIQRVCGINSHLMSLCLCTSHFLSVCRFTPPLPLVHLFLSIGPRL